MRTPSSPSWAGVGASSPSAASSARPWTGGRSSGACSPPELIPELETERLTVRLARPGMQASMARFLSESFPGHLDRWSPPVTADFFTEAFSAERLGYAVDDYSADRAARFVLQPRGAGTGGPIIGACNSTNIVRGAFHACHLGYQVDRDLEGQGLTAEALSATNAFMFESRKLHRIM